MRLVSLTDAQSTALPQTALRLVQEEEVAYGRIAYDKRLSPDGLKVVYIDDEKPHMIVVKELSTGVERKYEQTPYFYWSFPPVWSPDGKRIAFMDVKDPEIWKVSILTLESGDLEKTDIGTMPCDWSGDGRFLLVVDMWKNGTKGLELVDLKTGETQSVNESFKLVWYHDMPRLSPDGKYVTYHVQDSGIYVQPIGSVEPTLIISNTEELWSWYPLWTANGKQILFMRDNAVGNSDLLSIAFQDGKPIGEPAVLVSDLTSGDAIHSMLYSCTKSGHLLFAERDKQSEIYSTTIDPVSGSVLGEPTQLTDSTSRASCPVWSRNGKYIAYYEITESEEFHLWVMNSDGSDKKTLGNISVYTRSPMAWHPDNEHILYPGREADPENPDKTLDGIYSVSIRTHEHKLIYHDPEFQGGMDISPDGKHLALTSRSDEKPQLYIVDYDGQNRRQLVKAVKGGVKVRRVAVKEPAFTPNGKEIIYTFQVREEGKEDRRRIMAVSIEGGEPREIYAREDRAFNTSPASWLPDGRFVFDIRRRNPGDRSQYALNMDGKSGPVRISDALGGWYSISPDGTNATFTQNTTTHKLWLMSDFLPKDVLAKN